MAQCGHHLAGNGSGLVMSQPHQYGWPDRPKATLSEISQSLVDPLGEPGTLGDRAARTPFPLSLLFNLRGVGGDPWWIMETALG
jgi:hypothetical protein